jgi:RNA polymerase sigma factor (sigma-70 family)
VVSPFSRARRAGGDGFEVPTVGATPTRDWHGFAALVEPLRTKLYRSALLLTGDRAAAEDLVADTLVATWGPWSRGVVDDLGGYTHRSLHNRWLSAGRRSTRFQKLAPRLVVDERSTDADVADREALLAALASLAPRQRAVIVARYYGDMSVADCASALSMSEGTVKSTTSDALTRLRAALGEEAAP